MGDKDWISELPDALLCHILSFLPTIWAVRTTVLSTRWNNVWTCVPDLDFDCTRDSYFYYHGCKHDRFDTFVDRVLRSRDSSDIKKFRLWTCVNDLARVESWICTAVMCNVVELNLYLHGGDKAKENIFLLPSSVFSCKTLKALTLSGTSRSLTYAPDLASRCFPCLKSLHVCVHYPCRSLMEKLFTNCPVLEDLIIDATLGKDVAYKIKVSAPELKTLTIFLNEKHLGNNVLIDAPKLEKLDVQTNLKAVSNYSLDARSLVNANIDFDNNYSRVPVGLLAGIFNVKYLTLKTSYFKAEDLPFFPNLKQLEVVVPRCKYWELLPVLLENAPNLEDLKLDSGTMGDEKHSKVQWNSPKVVPNCLSSHLKTITIYPFRRRRIDMEAAKYLLDNGPLLDKMTFYTTTYWHTPDVGSELLMFNRASMTCEVEYKLKQLR